MFAAWFFRVSIFVEIMFKDILQPRSRLDSKGMILVLWLCCISVWPGAVIQFLGDNTPRSRSRSRSNGSLKRNGQEFLLAFPFF